MATTYSTYEAKARFSEVLRRVRGGETVVITFRGEPTAEIRPIPRERETLLERLRRLEQEGRVTPARGPGDLRPLAQRPGALRRFLEDRE